MHRACSYVCTVVSCKYAPPFCNLSLSIKRKGVGGRGGEAYMRDVPISLVITPSLPIKHNVIFGGGWRPSVRQRDPPDTSGRLTSFCMNQR